MSRYGHLTNEMRRSLGKIAPTVVFSTKYYPCDIRLNGGNIIERVIVVEERGYFARWGVWPEHDIYKRSILISEVAEIFESRHRLPAKEAQKIYDGGESGMGYYLWSVNFKDGFEYTYVGGVVDFIVYPDGYNFNDIDSVYIGDVGASTRRINAPEFHWCIYSI